ncbi:MAG TPA: carbohydrate kinase family protein [Anaerolineae bacterium]|nr:carbohydrate kinase family protein [Anaerolineae bacterium]
MLNSKIDVLVIGGASLDTLHLATGQTVSAAGGAGLYTALGAARSGAQAGMFAPRPDPMPIELQPAADRLTWIGPSISPDQLPHFEIAHYGQGRAELVNATWGGEMLLTPEMLPDDLLGARFVHVAALRNTDRQFNFAKACKAKGARVSAGTYGHICATEPDRVRALFDLVDLFFMNENEATLLFGSVEAARTQPGHILFITLSARGALVLQGEHATHVPGVPAIELDPTGAGDTFCGATLAALTRGDHPIMAAKSAALLAAELIGAVGPMRLLSDQPAPNIPLDDRCQPVPAQIIRVADLISRLPEVQPFNFAGDFFPSIHHPHALDFFFAVTLQQFSFWEFTSHSLTPSPDNLAATSANQRLRSHQERGTRKYSRPMIATIDGRTLKGSDYLFYAYLRQLDREPDFFSPSRQAALTLADLEYVFRADDGSNPMPAIDLHLELANSFGRDLLSMNVTPDQLVRFANEAEHPRQTFLTLLDHIGGYKEDPLRKKSMLLALILEQRPEKFLRPAPHEPEPPVIDYHLMRSCLRTGLIEITDEELRRRLIGREELSAEEEWAVRFAAYQVIQQVQIASNRPMGAVDQFFFGARRRCPEMTEPDCPACAIDPVCAHRKELFQPVLRTTFY